MEFHKDDDITTKNLEFFKICCKKCDAEIGYLQQGEEKIYVKTSSVQCPHCEMNYCCYKCAHLIIRENEYNDDLLKLLELYENLHSKLFSDLNASIEDSFNAEAAKLELSTHDNLFELLKNNVSCCDCRIDKTPKPTPKTKKSKCLIV